MTHLDGGAIAAVRDGFPIDADARTHLDSCSTCQAALADSKRRADVVIEALRALDAPIDTRAAKTSLRARLDAAREAERSHASRFRSHLGRAAAVLLLTAGAAYAIPGSPVRGWLSAVVGAPEVAPAAPTGAPGQPAPGGGIEVEIPGEGLNVVLTGVRPGSEVDVVWTETSEARIDAPAGSRYALSEGRAEATVAAGALRVALPRSGPTVSLTIDGRTYLRRGPSGLELLEPAAERTEDRIRFVVQQR